MNFLIALGAAFLGWMAPGGGKIAHNVRYAAHDRGVMDVYEPKRGVTGAPLVVFVYGGSWQSGDKSLYRFVGKLLASRGFVAVIPDYRVYPAVKYPDFLHDNAEAVAFAKSHAADWGADASRLFLAGHSAGAYDVAMLGIDRRWLGGVGLDPRRDVSGVIGLAGPYDFLPLKDDTLKIIFGPEDTRPDTQPINHVDGTAPPMLIFAGSKDSVVDPGNTPRLTAAIQAHGGKITARIVPGKGHIGLLTSLLPSSHGRSEILNEVADFIQSTPAPAAALKSAA